jgi:hypothetical protein
LVPGPGRWHARRDMAVRRRCGGCFRLLPLVLLAPACVSLQLQSKDSDGTSFSAPTEDGSRYVSVQGGAASTEKSTARRWKKVAEDACRGDYIVLSDASFERRDRGGAKRRVHEGFVRCVESAES